MGRAIHIIRTVVCQLINTSFLEIRKITSFKFIFCYCYCYFCCSAFKMFWFLVLTLIVQTFAAASLGIQLRTGVEVDIKIRSQVQLSMFFFLLFCYFRLIESWHLYWCFYLSKGIVDLTKGFLKAKKNLEIFVFQMQSFNFFFTFVSDFLWLATSSANTYSRGWTLISITNRFERLL